MGAAWRCLVRLGAARAAADAHLLAVCVCARGGATRSKAAENRAGNTGVVRATCSLPRRAARPRHSSSVADFRHKAIGHNIARNIMADKTGTAR
jgi:hypothetical protein